MLYALVYRAEEKKHWIGFRLRPGTVYLVFELNKRKKTEMCIDFSTTLTVEMLSSEWTTVWPDLHAVQGPELGLQNPSSVKLLNS